MSTILVADDEESLRLLIRTTLEGPECTILEASDGSSALEMVRRERPDLIVLDWMMPGKDGLEVARAGAATACVFQVLSGARKRGPQDRRDRAGIGGGEGAGGGAPWHGVGGEHAGEGQYVFLHPALRASGADRRSRLTGRTLARREFTGTGALRRSGAAPSPDLSLGAEPVFLVAAFLAAFLLVEFVGALADAILEVPIRLEGGDSYRHRPLAGAFDGGGVLLTCRLVISICFGHLELTP